MLGTYDMVEKMEPKKGYWLAIPGEMSSTVSGIALNSYTKHLPVRGWYMIGGVMGVADFTNPTDRPDGMVLSPAFGWNTGSGAYFQTVTLDETAGYWAAVIGECDLNVESGGVTLPKASGTMETEAFFQLYGENPPGLPNIDWETGKLLQIPKEYKLSQNYPNPFNPETRLTYQLSKAGDVEIVIYDILGRIVLRLASGHREPGSYETVWDGKDASGASLGSGTYLVRMKAGEFSCMKKMVLMR
jgi:hypothetical protein